MPTTDTAQIPPVPSDDPLHQRAQQRGGLGRARWRDGIPAALAVVVLHAAAGWKHREVAAFMAMPVQHAIVKYNRAIRKLAKKLRQNENTDKKSNIFRILVIF